MQPLLSFSGTKSNCQCNRLANVAAESLQRGKVIGVPTDTIYGVAALAQSTEAVESLYEIKRRHREKPIAICVADIDDIYRYIQYALFFI